MAEDKVLEAAKAAGQPVEIIPVDGNGVFLPDTPLVGGVHVNAANGILIERMRADGTLLAAGNITPWWIHQPVRRLLDACRAINEMVFAMLFIVVQQRRQRPYLAMGWFWYLGMLVPVIGIVQVGMQAMADVNSAIKETVSGISARAVTEKMTSSRAAIFMSRRQMAARPGAERRRFLPSRARVEGVAHRLADVQPIGQRRRQRRCKRAAGAVIAPREPRPAVLAQHAVAAVQRVHHFRCLVVRAGDEHVLLG